MGAEGMPPELLAMLQSQSAPQAPLAGLEGLPPEVLQQLLGQ
jgi:hypothetical protein